MKKSIYIVLISVFGFVSCDEVDDPIPADLGQSISLGGDIEFIVEPDLNIADTTALKDLISNNTWDTIVSPNDQTKRNVVLEEFTGHQCRQCPDGTREITRLKGIFGKQLIPIGIHAGDFAQPKRSGTKYRSNYIVAGGHGLTLQSRFNLLGYPSGIVSRVGGSVTGLNQWEPDINSIKDDVPVASIKLSNYYSAAVNVVRSEIEITWNQTLADSVNLQVDLVQDSIIDWQLDGATDVEFYVHKHVLRKVINDTYGKRLKPAIAGDVEKIQYIYGVDPSWNAKDIEVISFIFEDTPNSLDILQASSAHIK